MLRLLSWNVNGIRAVQKKDLLQPIFQENWDIIALQETKAQPDQLEKNLTQREGYSTFWASAERKGYSGTALFIRKDLAQEGVRVYPMKEILGENPFDVEGRTLIAEFPRAAGNFYFVNCYFPNSQDQGKRLDYKLEFNRSIETCCNELSQNHSRCVILCGDYNVAVREIDLARPDDNHESPGFLPEERQWMESFLAGGYTDSFRHFCPDKTEAYTWWSYRTRARERNIGWRIDYHCINKPFAPCLRSAAIHDEVQGSDHCPVSIGVEL